MAAASGVVVSAPAEKSGHYIYLDQPDVAVRAIERVAVQAAG